MCSLAHIINPVIVDKTSDLYVAQPVTFESMRLAQIFAKEKVELYSAQYSEDVELVPRWISRTRNLDRSVLDVGRFKKQRKLPLLRDILDRLYESSGADYFIYTNVDIALMPHFYTTVACLIETGLDAMIINRRTIPISPSDPKVLPLMWAQVGKKHPGHDCFIFKRELLPKLKLGDICIGVNWVGRLLLWNLVCYAGNFREISDMHLTFHLGDDKVWKNSDFSDYVKHNKNEAMSNLQVVQGEIGVEGTQNKLRPYLADVEDALNSQRQGESQRSWIHKLFGPPGTDPQKKQY